MYVLYNNILQDVASLVLIVLTKAIVNFQSPLSEQHDVTNFQQHLLNIN